ncbi:lamin tail domain-containing protein, partial [candidate division WOR-3 bacterium]|nr:lamin tail domain-containing protein [candidate division WOR-3 bacterium]
MNELKLLFIAIIVFSITASANVKINEIVPKGGTEWVELYNTSSSPVSLNGWKLTNSRSDEKALSGTINENDYDTICTSSMWNNDGDIVYLVNSTNDTVDQVGFGIQGGAPGAPYSPLFSLARITDGLDTDDDARDFNLDGTPTPELSNDPASVSLGGSLIINEIDPYTSGEDSVELYNPTGTPYDIQGWFLSDGDDVALIVTDVSISPFGYLVLVNGEDFDLGSYGWTSKDVCYLFTDDSVRIDQLGWYGEDNDFSFQRYPDGAGPNDGYDWITSGGDTTLFDAPPTWGGSNTSGVEERDMPVGYKLTVPGISKGNISIQYTLPERAYMTISLFDQLGRLISILVDETQNPGY